MTIPDGYADHSKDGSPAGSPDAYGFHPVLAAWLQRSFAAPSPPQRRGWPVIARGLDTLVAAPTGSGKTLTAFLVGIDHLVRQSLAGTLSEQTTLLYVSPLKALASDVQRNLEAPLAEIQASLRAAGYTGAPIRVQVRSGDTPASQRAAMLKHPPHILVTTPESLYLLLTGERGRALLSSVRTVIVDEIHALARDKRGTHLALSLARLDHLTSTRPQRIGLSATQKPIEQIAAFLVGNDAHGAPRPCTIIDVGHQRDLDLGLEVPPSPLATVCSQEQWEEIYQRLGELIQTHRSTLIFVNTRKMAERVAYHLAQQLGEDAVTSHHGSLAKERRLAAEAKLKAGELKAIVATASLELGIDIGAIDLVCQIGPARSIAVLLQRVGRAGHRLGAIPKGRIFALTRDELCEAMALIRAVRLGQLDAITIPGAAIDILAQQITAEVAAAECDEDELFGRIRQAYPYRDLRRDDYAAVLAMLAGGFSPDRQKQAFLHRDRLGGKLRARRGARLSAVTSGGAIPEQGDFRVINESDGGFVGTVNEDFAVESNGGDIFLLGSHSWQFVQLKGTQVMVRDAHGAPPTIPFWLGEAPGRTAELSGQVAALRHDLDQRIVLPAGLDDPVYQTELLSAAATAVPQAYRDACLWLQEACGVGPWAALQAVHYMAIQKAAMGVVPTQEQVVFERFFDQSGGMQLVIHAPFGMRINRGWGLALRKCFCRSFDFELQASADNDGIVLSLGAQQSFPIDALFRLLSSTTVADVLTQAVLQAPLFQVRWRWNTTRSLAVARRRGGQAVPPALQRFRADDLMTAVFPAQTQCQENVTGDIVIPDHPLVRQTLHDCLYEAIDLPGLTALLERIERGEVALIARDTREPSPFAYQLLNAYPYAFLDDAPLEERRARAVQTRQGLRFEHFNDLSRLSPEAVQQVRDEARPEARNADELHDVLSMARVLPRTRVDGAWDAWMDELVAAGRAMRVQVRPAGGRAVELWSTAEGLDLVLAAYPQAVCVPCPELPERLRQTWEDHAAQLEIVRGALAWAAITTAAELSTELGLPPGSVEAILPALEARGEALRGRYTADCVQWCERRLLMRIHKLTIEGLRQQIQPVPVADFLRFLTEHQGLAASSLRQERAGLADVLSQLMGFEAAAGMWEAEILASRLTIYQSQWLDELTHGGLVTWGRLQPPTAPDDRPSAATGMTRAVPLAFMHRDATAWLLPPQAAAGASPAAALARANARLVYELLLAGGAQFMQTLKAQSGLLDTQLEEALGELCWLGLINADGFAAIRPFVSRNRKTLATQRRGLNQRLFAAPSYSLGGRWALFPGPVAPASDEERTEHWAWLLLQRYGVVFRDLLARESAAPSWGALAKTYRRLEARGEVRGGRFVAGVLSEQFALPEVVSKLRACRDRPKSGEWVVLSAADPLNLIGILTPEPRVASSRQMLLVLRDGVFVASGHGAEVTLHQTLAPEVETAIRQALQLSGVFRQRRQQMS